MKPFFHPSLVNDPFGDPGLLVQFMFEKRAMLFDLGNNFTLPSATLLKVSHVFVSHTHIDHFIGFDRLLRVSFGRGKTLRMYGPENFIANVEGKLAGFTWNLVDRYEESLTIEVTEVREDRLLKVRFRAVDKFKRSEAREEPFADGLLLDEPSFTVRTAILEHRVPCLGFAFEEKFHVNIRKEKLEAMNFRPGAWLTQLKENIYCENPDDVLIAVDVINSDQAESKEYPLGELKKELAIISEGQKIGYIVDTVYSDANKKKIVDLVQGADQFFCESPFLADEEERGRDRCHLTTKQAGLLAKEAKVKQLKVFHFSSKHTHRRDQFYQEAEAAFKNSH